ncbi:hypothetical protein [Sphingomonas sp. BK235]|uniref:hypothetical protein n=1 Tax=Sphingomonas sp. BK235 TaxID=2512131 RepID=UPI001049B2CB|nr:hypothetical protein [Sphingomonas sp. BK235]TCP33262.1 hypothetical protein EV292_106204 [Sphingomonas sp. BK235]
MKLADLALVSALERKRTLLIDLRDNGWIPAHIIGSSQFGGHRTDLRPAVVDGMRAVVNADLNEQIAAVDRELRGFGIEVD